MSNDAGALTTEDLEFLRRPLHGFLSVAAGPVPAQPRPVWFEATDEGTIQLFTGPATLKVRRLRRDPRASIVVAAPVGEPERWVS
ncbi:MAG: pyridoxamine 5'-phosphate oxidase family protein, partial [Actinomycetes bacterium]